MISQTECDVFYVRVFVVEMKYLPPLQTPFGNVDQPKPCPQGRTHANVAFASVSCVLLLRIATAASLRTFCALRTASRLLRLDDTSEFVAAVIVNDIEGFELNSSQTNVIPYRKKKCYSEVRKVKAVYVSSKIDFSRTCRFHA